MPRYPHESILRILHLENDPLDSELALALLRSDGLSVDFHRIDTMPDFQRALQGDTYALCLADYSVPGVNPIEALRLARQIRPEVPFVFLSGSMGEELAIETLKLGATDYVLKHRLERLAPAVRRALQEAEEVSRLKYAEETVNRLAAIVESSPDAIYSKALDGTILSWNRGAEKIFGYTAEEMVGGSLDRLVPPDRVGDLEEINQKIQRGERIAQYETECLHREGRRIHVSLAISPILNEAGRVVEAAAIARDITSRKQSEEAIQKANEELRTSKQLLESRVRERTAQLRALAAKLTRAEETERRRVAQVLHEGLQQVLVGAQYRLQSLKARSQDPPIQQGLTQIQEVLSESVRLSRSLTYELSPPILYLGDMVAILKWLGRWYQEKHGLEVRVEIEDPVEVPREEIRVALFRSVLELLLNVVKHAQALSARVRLGRTPEGQVQIEVGDEGVGFDPEKARQPEQTGVGFGLFHLRERLEMLGGRLEVKSAPGQGSRVALLVPHESLPESEPPEVPPSLPKSTSDSRKIRILLADDHPIVRNGLARVIRDEPDLEVVGQASDGLQAVELTRSLQPDVVIMDVSMPNLDGVEATRRVHAECPEIKVIGLSMYDDPSHSSIMRQAGAVDFVIKTGPPSDLIDAIRAHSPARP